MVNADGTAAQTQGYYPWGETRFGSLGTEYQFTGQYRLAALGLDYFNARWYDSALGRFAQADSIVPLASQGVQAWDRYAFVNNNPVRYTDPGGHAVDDGCNQGECGNWKPKTNAERRNNAFSLMFLGSGENGAWTTKDWDYYLDNYNDLWNGDTTWINPDSETGWDLFALHAERLASNYSPDQADQFMRDFGLVFGGISVSGSWVKAAWDARHGPTIQLLYEGNQGLSPQFTDSLDPRTNQSHHYAGILFLSYFVGGGPGAIANYARDPDNPGDINLGTVAAIHGALLTGSAWKFTIQDLPVWIDSLSP